MFKNETKLNASSKIRENKNALKIAESLFKNNRYNFLCVLIYLDLLLRSYEFDKLVDVITLFFTILPKKMGKYDVEKFAALLQLFEAKHSILY